MQAMAAHLLEQDREKKDSRASGSRHPRPGRSALSRIRARIRERTREYAFAGLLETRWRWRDKTDGDDGSAK